MPHDKFPLAEFEAIGYQACWAGQKTYNGVAVISRDPARSVQINMPGFPDDHQRLIAATLPSRKGLTYMLDLGANADCTPEHLLQFAIMGAMLVSCVEHKERPTVGLLNIGSEDIKGNEVVKQAGELLRASHLNFYGNIEGNDIYKGTTDLVVCDGFVGNVALKTSEGLAQMMGSFLGQEFKRNWMTKIMALAAMPVLKAFRKRLDHRRYNGASFLGLQGTLVKSHGSADKVAFENALKMAKDQGLKQLPKKNICKCVFGGPITFIVIRAIMAPPRELSFVR